MASRLQFLNSSEIGVFCKLTNTYCLASNAGSDSFFSYLEGGLTVDVPIVKTSIAGTRIVGRLTCGNSKGLLVPAGCTDSEYQQLKEELPESVVIRRIDDKLSALGNCIATNDSVAIIHPDMDQETEEIISDTLGVEVFRSTVAKSVLVGSYLTVNNNGGLTHPLTTTAELDEISNLFMIPIAAGTLNRGSDIISGGCLVNDKDGFVGIESTAAEINIFNQIFKLSSNSSSDLSAKLMETKMESLL